MENTREIVTKAVVGKGKKTFIDEKSVSTNIKPDTILGCWVINHNFSGKQIGSEVLITGSYDVNIWYSCENDTKTEVVKDSVSYKEKVNMPTINLDDVDNKEVVIRSIKQPTCTKCEIDSNNIKYSISKDLGIEIVGDVKVKIQYENIQDNWEELSDNEKINNEIDKNVNENYL